MVKFAHQHADLQLEISFNDRNVDLIEEGFDLCIRIGALPDTTPARCQTDWSASNATLCLT